MTAPAAAAPLATDPKPDAVRGALWALLLLAITIGSANTVMGLFSPVQEAAKAELGLTDFELSLLQGLAASIPVALLAVPIGRMVDRGGRVRILVGMAALWSVGAALTAFAPGFGALFVGRMLAGVGAMCALPVAISLAADLSAPERRGRSLLLLSLGKIVGGAAAFAAGGAVFAALDASGERFAGLEPWRAVQLVFAGVSLLLAVPLLFMREPERREVSAETATLVEALAEIWSRRAFLGPLFLGQIGVVLADVAALVWAAPVLTRAYGQQPGDFAGWMGLALLVSGVLGSLIGGFGADRGMKSGRKGGVLTAAVLCALVAIPAALFPLAPNVPVFGVALAVLLLCGSACGLITATALAVVVPNQIRGVCLSAFIVLASIIGFGVGPTLVTVCADLMGGETRLPQALAITGLVVNLISAAGFVTAWRRARRA